MLLLIHLLFARGFISAHPGGRTTSLSKMDWGKTKFGAAQSCGSSLSSSSPQTHSGPGNPAEPAERRRPAQARPPGRRAGLGISRGEWPAGLCGARPWDCGEAPGPHCQWIYTGWGRRADPHRLGTSFQSACSRSKPPTFGHTEKCTI